MQITCGSEWFAGENGKRSYSAGLDESDGAAMVAGWDQMSPTERIKALGKKADIIVLAYMFQAGAISQEYMMGQIKLVHAR